MFPRPAFFAGCELNFAENLLFPASQPDPLSLAIREATETTRRDVTWKDLRERVRICAAGLVAAGVKKDDRVAGYLANHANTVVAMLAATSLGALWTGVSPDTGVHAVLDRLKQVEPVLLFTDNAVKYNQKTHETHAKLSHVASELPSVKTIVVFETIPGHPFDLNAIPTKALVQTESTFLENADLSRPLTFLPLPPDHPVYILYSSGTTGTPKPIVHSALGTLLQHKKEHAIHCDVHPGDTIFYFTTCTWMMWHWLVSGLASGATIVLYDGSPFQPHKEISMPLLIDELGINHFGTSAKYLSVLEQAALNPAKAEPKSAHLSSLRSIFSTGSPLAPSTFQYVYKSLKADILLGSITGGTDIISLFGAPCPNLPVHAGEIQCRGLGMSVKCFDASGKDITSSGEEGEKRYRSSYFETFTDSKTNQPIWHHGDFIRVNPKTGGIWMLGRSDGVLNPMGVRFGSSEIYNILLKHFSASVEDALCIGRRRPQDSDEVVVLFLKMAPKHEFSQQLVKEIQDIVRKELSARHVPKVIEETPEIPYTMNGKKVEGAVKQILSGTNVKTSASVANAGCLEFYKEWAQKK
ncbi:hypothetical protein LTR64_003754 [Lithohypha guttulata]|uniref:uncharacterized protein n=1 Tax=Lithohypha guttulata TaxID=1690604 RepID=UPI002DDFC13D|nr:hypothetical protein LTR51_000026 [Lithohypha guttulata]